MNHTTRGRAAGRAIAFCAVAALGLALSACGGSSGGASSATSAQSVAPAQATTTPPASTAAPAPATTSAPAAASTAAPAQNVSTATAQPPSSSNPPTATIGTVILNWNPPTQNVDGTPLTNLAGYHIHYGSASGKYTQTLNVSNPGIATYVVQDLPAGTYYFSVAAVNSQGTESPMSSEVSTRVN